MRTPDTPAFAELTLEHATKVREAFGPCSIVYETMTPEELVKDWVEAHAAEDPPASIGAWVLGWLDVEEVHGDRALDARGASGEYDMEAEVREHQAWMRELQRRITEAGLVPVCHYDHHTYETPCGATVPSKGLILRCKKCRGPLACGPFEHACPRCERRAFERCTICRKPRVYCCC